ncbi:MAG: DNA repair protein RadA [Synergistales bacterium]|nr:DNA repair protein RadA [Synergistales bacterium]
MPKQNITYCCLNCGYKTISWTGKCPTCGAWGSLEMEKSSLDTSAIQTSGTVALKDIMETERVPSGIGELDNTLGGGWMRGGVYLIAGEPGIGKSTLLLQSCASISTRGNKVLYISGEESQSQIAERGKRLGLMSPDLFLRTGGDIDRLLEDAEDFDFIVLDSVQSVVSEEESGLAGAPGQVRTTAQKCISFAKEKAIPFVLVGHITRAGTIAGPMLLEHMVDSVLRFSGDRNSSIRIIRALKNRFGSTDEAGLFEMTPSGLEQVKDPGSLYWNKAVTTVSGVAMTVMLEGSLPFLVEVQSLALRSSFPYPKRTSQGIDVSKINLISAVLDKRCALNTCSSDIYVNVTGGLTIKDPSCDLALAASIMSSSLEIILPPDTCFLGEVGLAGEIRPVPRLKLRIAEARKRGFNNIFMSALEKGPFPESLKIIKLHHLKEILEVIDK